MALLPRVAEVVRETLADSLGLFATFTALWLASKALTKGDWRLGIGSGLAAGLGYLARPEVILVPAVIALAWLVDRARRPGATRPPALTATAMMLLVPALAVCGYAAVKGEISEKLAIRQAAGLGPQKILVRPVPQQVPRGLDDPRWDFSPKEETDHVVIRGAEQSFKRILGRWWEEMAWFFAVMTVWGWASEDDPLLRGAGSIDADLVRMVGPESPSQPGIEVCSSRCSRPSTRRPSCGTAPRWDTCRGGTSSRWSLRRSRGPREGRSSAAAGSRSCCGWALAPPASAGSPAMAFALGLSVSVQLNPNHLNHLSRWGHREAGHWLSSHAAPDEEVLDTRGWGRFVSGRPGYDYWHVRQALTDARLSYILVGLDELRAASSRAATLRALLGYVGTPLADFPGSPGDPTPAVRIYRYRRPASWEGIVR